MSRRIFCKVLLVAVVIFVLSVLSGVLPAQGRSDEAFERVKEVHQKHTNRLMAIKGVEGTAVGFNQNDRLAIKVFTARPGVAGIPKKLDGVPTQMVVTGKFLALGKPDKPPGKPDKPGGEKVDPTARFGRPVPIGVSTGNEGECSAGTIGCRVTKAGVVYALSNNHVYALENEAELGSEVLQPGLYDTACVYSADNLIGTLADYAEIKFDGSGNTIDAAIAISSTDNLGNATPSDGYGTPKSETVAASLNQKVKKYGRTTSLTKGTVTGVSANIWVTYGSGTARFVGQIIVEARKPFIKSGDSGSLLVTQEDNKPVGLLFAGNGSGKFAVANHIDPVLDAFGVAIDGE